MKIIISYLIHHKRDKNCASKSPDRKSRKYGTTFENGSDAFMKISLVIDGHLFVILQGFEDLINNKRTVKQVCICMHDVLGVIHQSIKPFPETFHCWNLKKHTMTMKETSILFYYVIHIFW